MERWYYHHRPTNKCFNDLTPQHYTVPRNYKTLLGLSLKFCPNSTTNDSWTTFEDKSWQRLDRDINVKASFSGGIEDDSDYNRKMYVRSNYNPRHHTTFDVRLRKFKLKHSFRDLYTERRFMKPNLDYLQRRALRSLQKRGDLLVVQCDKNLGPALILRKDYVNLIFRDHLSNTSIYEQITERAKTATIDAIRRALRIFYKRHKIVFDKKEYRFLLHHLANNKTPLPCFYATMKVHKEPLKTRPIVSCSGSLFQPLGLWVDSMLQKVACVQPAYFKNSFDLKEELVSLDLPPGTRLFTADARSMYTNIPTDKAIQIIGDYLRENTDRFPSVPITPLLEALYLIMKYNYFTFGDTVYHQKDGTAMGTNPAPPYANLYFALFEKAYKAKFTELRLYRRFLDDVLGAWKGSDETRFQLFMNTMNDPSHGLTWDFIGLADEVVFMDLRIRISPEARISTSLYEKPMNTHLYIPPLSAHPPGLLPGLIYGMLNRFERLISEPREIITERRRLYQRLRARGWPRNQLLPVFTTALAGMRLKTLRRTLGLPATDRPTDDISPTFLHLEYNPANPSSRDLQRVWRNSFITIDTDPRRITTLPNHEGNPLQFDRLIVAYSRPPNLGNLLSYRRLSSTPYFQASSMIYQLDTDSYGTRLHPPTDFLAHNLLIPDFSTTTPTRTPRRNNPNHLITDFFLSATPATVDDRPPDDGHRANDNAHENG